MDDPFLFYFLAGIFTGLILPTLVRKTVNFMDWLHDFKQWRKEKHGN